jgi:hypothetical protein
VCCVVLRLVDYIDDDVDDVDGVDDIDDEIDDDVDVVVSKIDFDFGFVDDD